MLDSTGTVVGLFPAMRYEEKVVPFGPGDVLVAYTDGVTEPENAYGEEFGTERLTDLVRRNQTCEPREMAAKLMEAVRHWTGAEELPDDMTILLARGLE